MRLVFAVPPIYRKAVRAVLLCLTAAALASGCDTGSSDRPEASPNETEPGNAERLLRGLPADNRIIIFAEIEKVYRRSAMRQEVEEGFEELSERTHGLIGKELLTRGDVESLAYSLTVDEITGATIISGNFEGFIDALREAVSLAEANVQFGPPHTADSYRGLEVFVFPWYHDLYVAAPDSETVLLADSASLLEEVVDRHLDGGALDASLAGLLGSVDAVDFLVAIDTEDVVISQVTESSPPLPVFTARAGYLNEGRTSTAYAYLEFAEDAHANEALELVSKQDDLSGLFLGYKRETVLPEGDLWRDGRALIGRAVVPDKDVSDLLLPN